jgi:hypothetical protein
MVDSWEGDPMKNRRIRRISTAWSEVLVSLGLPPFPGPWDIGDKGFASQQVGIVGDSAAIEIPPVVLARVIDFQDWALRSNEFEGLFAFCVEYLRVRGSLASHGV